MSWDRSPIYGDADMQMKAEIHTLVKYRDSLPQKSRKIITEKEWNERRKLGLPCDGFVTLTEFRRLYRGHW